MKIAILAGAVILMAASTSVYAQTTQAVPGFPDVKVLPVDQTPAPATATTPETPSAGSGIRQQLAANLQKAGFTGVQIVPEAFLVEAKNKSGEPVVMFLTPDSLTVFTAKDAKGKDARNDAAISTDTEPK